MVQRDGWCLVSEKASTARRALQQHFDLGVALALEQAHRDARAAVQPAELETIEEGGEARLTQPDDRRRGVDLEPETGLQERERRDGRPGLRRARNGVGRRRLAAAPTESAE